MGGGTWNVGSYTRAAASRAARGKSTFDYDEQVRAGRVHTVHPLLNPTATAGPTSPFAGQVMREVCVTDEHPDPTPILIWLDVTGSNYHAAQVVHSKLPHLQQYLRTGKFCTDPQINVSAIGDATCDRFPLQFGQFESDNRLDAQIEVLILEGGGGGQCKESYELAAYMSARHVHLEPFELYAKKGFVFFIGDEMPYQLLENNFTAGHWSRHHTLQSLTGDTLATPLPTKAIFDELKRKNHVFFLFQKQGAYQPEDILPAWEATLGKEHIVELDDPATVVEVIAALIARFEAGLTADETTAAMTKSGASSTEITHAIQAIEKYTPPADNGRRAQATGTIESNRGAFRL